MLLQNNSGRASAYGTGGPGLDSRGRVIPKTLKMVVMASLLGAQELRLALRPIRRCQYRITGRVLVPGVSHKPQGDSKSAVLSLNSGLLPEIATP